MSKKYNNHFSYFSWLIIPIVLFSFNFVKNKYLESENVSGDLVPISELTANEMSKGPQKEWDKFWEIVDKEDEEYEELQNKIYPYFKFIKGSSGFSPPPDTPLWVLTDKINRLIDIHHRNHNLWKPLVKSENKWIKAFAISSVKSSKMSAENAKVFLQLANGENVNQDISSWNRNQNNIGKINEYQEQLDKKFEKCLLQIDQMLNI